MSEQEQTRPAELRKRVEQELADTAANLGVNAGTYSVMWVGQTFSGYYQVQIFQEGGSTAYGSDWPQWAFDLAKSALLHNKKIFVEANGDPVGPNLTRVLIWS
jgi:hypothetical protein